MSIVLNQVAIWVETDHDWDIFDLRNVVKNFIQDQLAMLGYIKGYVYDFEVTRVLSQSRSIDYVFGIDIPCISERGPEADLPVAMEKLSKKMSGPTGVLISRCFKDLASSMKYADDTGFYCYRAIESLRHHCASAHGLSEAEKPRQWGKFREVSGCSEGDIRFIKSAADPLRHGEIANASSINRERILKITWDIVDGYINCI